MTQLQPKPLPAFLFFLSFFSPVLFLASLSSSLHLPSSLIPSLPFPSLPFLSSALFFSLASNQTFLPGGSSSSNFSSLFSSLFGSSLLDPDILFLIFYLSYLILGSIYHILLFLSLLFSYLHHIDLQLRAASCLISHVPSEEELVAPGIH